MPLIHFYDRATIEASLALPLDPELSALLAARVAHLKAEGLDFRHSIDMQQLFAQVAAEVRGGANWWLDDAEEDELAAWNARHVLTSVVEDSLLAWIELDPDKADATIRVTPTQALKMAGIDRPTNPQAKEAAAVLRNLLGPSSRVGGRDGWKVPYREPRAADLVTEPIPKKRREPPPGDVF